MEGRAWLSVLYLAGEGLLAGGVSLRKLVCRADILCDFMCQKAIMVEIEGTSL